MNANYFLFLLLVVLCLHYTSIPTHYLLHSKQHTMACTLHQGEHHAQDVVVHSALRCHADHLDRTGVCTPSYCAAEYSTWYTAILMLNLPPSVFFLFCAFVLLVIVSVSVPVWDVIA